MSKANGSKQTSTGSVGVDLGAVSRFKPAAVTVITGCSLACCGSGWVRGWVLGTWSGKSLLCFLVEIHLSWLCQPPTFSILEQWQKKRHRDLCLSGLWYCDGPEKTLSAHTALVHWLNVCASLLILMVSFHYKVMLNSPFALLYHSDGHVYWLNNQLDFDEGQFTWDEELD